MARPSKCLKSVTKNYFLPITALTSSLAAIFSLMMVACASPKPPTQKIQAAELAISHAEQQQVAEYSSPELREAREKLTAARAAVAQDHMVDAQRLAEQSQLDADLAAARSNAVKAKLVNDEMAKSTSALQQEMQRNTGEQK